MALIGVEVSDEEIVHDALQTERLRRAADGECSECMKDLTGQDIADSSRMRFPYPLCRFCLARVCSDRKEIHDQAA